MAITFAFGLVALILWAVFAMLLFGALSGGRGAVRVAGEITGSQSFLERGRTMFVSKFRATTPDGRVVYGTGSFAKSWEPTIGGRVTLLYRAGDTTSPLVEPAGILGFLSSIIVGVLALAVSGLVIAIAVSIALSPADNPAQAAPHGRAPHGHGH